MSKQGPGGYGTRWLHATEVTPGPRTSHQHAASGRGPPCPVLVRDHPLACPSERRDGPSSSPGDVHASLIPREPQPQTPSRPRGPGTRDGPAPLAKPAPRAESPPGLAAQPAAAGTEPQGEAGGRRVGKDQQRRLLNHFLSESSVFPTSANGRLLSPGHVQVTPRLLRLAVFGFSYPWSTTVQKHYVENSRTQHLMLLNGRRAEGGRKSRESCRA